MSGQLSKLGLEEKLPMLLREQLEDIIKKEDYLTFDVYSRCLSTAGKSYMGELYEVDIDGKTAKGPKVLNLFIKKFIPEVKSKIIEMSEVYLNECFVYKELTQIYAELQEEASVPADQRFRTVMCYPQTSSQAIILENLTPRGFQNHPRQTMSLQYAELAIQELAKFHSLSFIIQKLRPDYYRNTITKIESPCNWEHFNLFAGDLMNKTSDSIDDEETRKRYKNTIPYILKRHPQLFNKNLNQVNALCHGDFRPNNILISRNENGCIKELVIVDYQLIEYGCPLRDFFLLMYSSTSDRQFREKYISYLKAHYYEAMKKFLQHFAIDIEEVFPSEIYESQFIKAREYGLSKLLIFSSFVFATETEYLVCTEEFKDQTLKMVENFQNYIREYVDEFFYWGYMVSV